MPERCDLGLRALRESDFGYFADGREHAREQDPYNFFGFRGMQSFARRFAEDGWLSEESGTLMVTRAEQVIGDVGWHAVQYGPPGAGRAFNIGILLLPEHRGQGYGAQAQRMLAEYLFAGYPVNRVEASTDVTNVAERRSLERAGFAFDGVLRGAQWRAGQWHDLAVYSRLRADP